MRGSVGLETKLGDLEVGIREGTAAWLDVQCDRGQVHNMLDASDAPEPSTGTVEVRARTSVGEIAIRRAEMADHEQATSTGTEVQIVVSRPFSRAGTHRSRRSFAALEPEERWIYHGTHGSG